VNRGWLHRLYRGVYALGNPNISREGRFLAAVEARGADAVLSHHSAAALHELVKWDGRPVDVTAPTKRSQPRVKAHRAKMIDRIVLKGIPVTPKLRTVIDLAKTTDEKTVKRALRQAKFSKHELERLPRRSTRPTVSPIARSIPTSTGRGSG
jgi:predicted transcriptional regulator of viral defense system